MSPRRRGERWVWEAADHPGAAARALRGERRWCSTRFWSRKGTTPVGAGRGQAAFSRDRHTHLYGDVQSHRFLKDGCKRSGWTLAPGAHRRDGPHAFCQQLHRTRLRWSPRPTDGLVPSRASARPSSPHGVRAPTLLRESALCRGGRTHSGDDRPGRGPAPRSLRPQPGALSAEPVVGCPQMSLCRFSRVALVLPGQLPAALQPPSV